MLKVSRSSLVRSAVLAFFASFAGSSAFAQAVPVSALDRQLSRLDLGVSGIGQITHGVAGTNYLGQPISLNASTTAGLLGTLRYTKSPFVGLEFNYTLARYTENFSAAAGLPGGAQTKANEYSIGWVVHTPRLFGIKTFVSGGAGTTEFSPTGGGGQGLPKQARMTYYYTGGLEDSLFTPHFGVRLQFRQAFFKAPDFGQNYLTIQKQTNTIEPGIGFYFKF